MSSCVEAIFFQYESKTIGCGEDKYKKRIFLPSINKVIKFDGSVDNTGDFFLKDLKVLQNCKRMLIPSETYEKILKHIQEKSILKNLLKSEADHQLNEENNSILILKGNVKYKLNGVESTVTKIFVPSVNKVFNEDGSLAKKNLRILKCISDTHIKSFISKEEFESKYAYQ